MGLFDFVKGDSFKAGRLPVEQDDVSGESPNDSAYKVAKEEKDVKKDVNTASPTTVAKIENARLNEGVFKPNVISASAINSADYYRRGRLKPPVDSTAPNANRKILNTQYDYNPRFLQDSENEEVASLRLIGKIAGGSKSEEVDLIPPYSKFFLESYQEGHMERSQIVETFGEFYAFFFGERPPVYTFGGTLLNTKDINWKEDFMFYYDNFLRGSKAVEYKAKVVLTYGLSQVEGYILGVNTQAQAANDKGVNVSFQMLVTKRRSMRLSIDFGILEDNGKFNEDQSIINMITLGVSNTGVSDAYKHAISVNQSGSAPSKTSQLTPAGLKSGADSLGGLNFKTLQGKVNLA